MTTEHTTEHTPDPIEIITTSLDNTRSLAGAWARRAACITDDLADAGLRIVATATYPSVTIIESLTGPTTCTVKVGDVVRFSGRSFTPDELADGPTVPEAAYHEMAAACRASTAEVDRLNAEIEGLQAEIARLTAACQQKNSDCETYATERQQAIKEKTAAENEAGDLRARWAAYATAQARLEQHPHTVHVVGKNVLLRHEDYNALERDRDLLRDSWVTAEQHESTVNRMTTELRNLRQRNAALADELSRSSADLGAATQEDEASREAARKWERLRGAIELMSDATSAELVMDGVRITPIGEI